MFKVSGSRVVLHVGFVHPQSTKVRLLRNRSVSLTFDECLSIDRLKGAFIDT